MNNKNGLLQGIPPPTTLNESHLEQAELLSQGRPTACSASGSPRPRKWIHLRISPSSRSFTAGHSLSMTL